MLKPRRRVQPILTPQYDRGAAWTRREILVLAADRASVLVGLPPLWLAPCCWTLPPNWLGRLAGPGQSGARPGNPPPTHHETGGPHPGQLDAARQRLRFSQAHRGPESVGSQQVRMTSVALRSASALSVRHRSIRAFHAAARPHPRASPAPRRTMASGTVQRHCPGSLMCMGPAWFGTANPQSLRLLPRSHARSDRHRGRPRGSGRLLPGHQGQRLCLHFRPSSAGARGAWAPGVRRICWVLAGAPGQGACLAGGPCPCRLGVGVPGRGLALPNGLD